VADPDAADALDQRSEPRAVNETTLGHGHAENANWMHLAIEAAALSAAAPYVGITDTEIDALATSPYAECPLLVRLRSALGDWRVVMTATRLVAWCAAEEPVLIYAADDGITFGPDDIRDVFPIERERVM